MFKVIIRCETAIGIQDYLVEIDTTAKPGFTSLDPNSRDLTDENVRKTIEQSIKEGRLPGLTPDEMQQVGSSLENGQLFYKLKQSIESYYQLYSRNNSPPDNIIYFTGDPSDKNQKLQQQVFANFLQYANSRFKLTEDEFKNFLESLEKGDIGFGIYDQVMIGFFPNLEPLAYIEGHEYERTKQELLDCGLVPKSQPKQTQGLSFGEICQGLVAALWNAPSFFWSMNIETVLMALFAFNIPVMQALNANSNANQSSINYDEYPNSTTALIHPHTDNALSPLDMANNYDPSRVSVFGSEIKLSANLPSASVSDPGKHRIVTQSNPVEHSKVVKQIPKPTKAIKEAITTLINVLTEDIKQLKLDKRLEENLNTKSEISKEIKTIIEQLNIFINLSKLSSFTNENLVDTKNNLDDLLLIYPTDELFIDAKIDILRMLEDYVELNKFSSKVYKALKSNSKLPDSVMTEIVIQHYQKYMDLGMLSHTVRDKLDEDQLPKSFRRTIHPNNALAINPHDLLAIAICRFMNACFHLYDYSEAIKASTKAKEILELQTEKMTRQEINIIQHMENYLKTNPHLALSMQPTLLNDAQLSVYKNEAALSYYNFEEYEKILATGTMLGIVPNDLIKTLIAKAKAKTPKYKIFIQLIDQYTKFLNGEIYQLFFSSIDQKKLTLRPVLREAVIPNDNKDEVSVPMQITKEQLKNSKVFAFLVPGQIFTSKIASVVKAYAVQTAKQDAPPENLVANSSDKPGKSLNEPQGKNIKKIINKLKNHFNKEIENAKLQKDETTRQMFVSLRYAAADYLLAPFDENASTDIKKFVDSLLEIVQTSELIEIKIDLLRILEDYDDLYNYVSNIAKNANDFSTLSESILTEIIIQNYQKCLKSGKLSYPLIADSGSKLITLNTTNPHSLLAILIYQFLENFHIHVDRYSALSNVVVEAKKILPLSPDEYSPQEKNIIQHILEFPEKNKNLMLSMQATLLDNYQIKAYKKNIRLTHYTPKQYQQILDTGIILIINKDQVRFAIQLSDHPEKNSNNNKKYYKVFSCSIKSNALTLHPVPIEGVNDNGNYGIGTTRRITTEDLENIEVTGFLSPSEFFTTDFYSIKRYGDVTAKSFIKHVLDNPKPANKNWPENELTQDIIYVLTSESAIIEEQANTPLQANKLKANARFGISFQKDTITQVYYVTVHTNEYTQDKSLLFLPIVGYKIPLALANTKKKELIQKYATHSFTVGNNPSADNPQYVELIKNDDDSYISIWTLFTNFGAFLFLIGIFYYWKKQPQEDNTSKKCADIISSVNNVKINDKKNILEPISKNCEKYEVLQISSTMGGILIDFSEKIKSKVKEITVEFNRLSALMDKIKNQAQNIKNSKTITDDSQINELNTQCEQLKIDCENYNKLQVDADLLKNAEKFYVLCKKQSKCEDIVNSINNVEIKDEPAILKLISEKLNKYEELLKSSNETKSTEKLSDFVNRIKKLIHDKFEELKKSKSEILNKTTLENNENNTFEIKIKNLNLDLELLKNECGSYNSTQFLHALLEDSEKWYVVACVKQNELPVTNNTNSKTENTSITLQQPKKNNKESPTSTPYRSPKKTVTKATSDSPMAEAINDALITVSSHQKQNNKLGITPEIDDIKILTKLETPKKEIPPALKPNNNNTLKSPGYPVVASVRVVPITGNNQQTGKPTSSVPQSNKDTPNIIKIEKNKLKINPVTNSNPKIGDSVNKSTDLDITAIKTNLRIVQKKTIIDSFPEKKNSAKLDNRTPKNDVANPLDTELKDKLATNVHLQIAINNLMTISSLLTAIKKSETKKPDEAINYKEHWELQAIIGGFYNDQKKDAQTEVESKLFLNTMGDDVKKYVDNIIANALTAALKKCFHALAVFARDNQDRESSEKCYNASNTFEHKYADILPKFANIIAFANDCVNKLLPELRKIKTSTYKTNILSTIESSFMQHFSFPMLKKENCEEIPRLEKPNDIIKVLEKLKNHCHNLVLIAELVARSIKQELKGQCDILNLARCAIIANIGKLLKTPISGYGSMNHVRDLVFLPLFKNNKNIFEFYRDERLRHSFTDEDLVGEKYQRNIPGQKLFTMDDLNSADFDLCNQYVAVLVERIQQAINKLNAIHEKTKQIPQRYQQTNTLNYTPGFHHPAPSPGNTSDSKPNANPKPPNTANNENNTTPQGGMQPQ